MDNANSGNGTDSSLTESWTLIDKEAIEEDDGQAAEEISPPDKETLPPTADENESTCELCGECPDYPPPDSTIKSPSEAAESIDSDGISIISESEEEEELQLLPCHPQVMQERSGSRSSNKYFDETDSSSQCSSRSQDFLGTESEKKYVHQPNSALNTSLNVLLAISCAAVLGLGMGHFLGLQEECSTGYAVEEKIVNTTQNEELSTLLLKKLELENNALKEQFVNLQMVIEEIRQNSSLSPCNNNVIKDTVAVNFADREEDEILDDVEGARCEVPREEHVKMGVGQSVPYKKNSHQEKKHMHEESIRKVASSSRAPVSSEGVVISKDDILPKLEKSLEDIASLFHDTLSGDKSLPATSQEALGVAFSVFSSLMENVQEKLNGLKKSMEEGTLNLDTPLKAIGKMEEVIQKTSQKIQKVAKDVVKEGQPLFTISNSVTTKLRNINKKLEHKWCQIKRNLSKQSIVLSWLDNQIFSNCSEDGGYTSEDDVIEKEHSDSLDGTVLKQSEGRQKKRKFENDMSSDKNTDAVGFRKKSRTISNNGNYKIKERDSRSEYRFEKSQQKYNKDNGNLDPNAFDFDYVPKKEKNKGNYQSSQKVEKKRKGYEAEKGNSQANSKHRSKQRAMHEPSGEWMEAMFNSRAERRRDERRSDWVFARAHARTQRKDTQPTRWYFRKGEENV